MKYIEAPDSIEDRFKKLFMAGAITGAPQWQNELLEKISDLDIVVYNPRRKSFDTENSGVAEQQIVWEYRALREADAISFWFCGETIAPIVMFELGAWTMTSKPIVVGMDPDYKRKKDVEIQVGLVRPDIKIVYNLNGLSAEIHRIMSEIIIA